MAAAPLRDFRRFVIVLPMMKYNKDRVLKMEKEKIKSQPSYLQYCFGINANVAAKIKSDNTNFNIRRKIFTLQTQ